MAEIINFQNWVNMKQEERDRLKKISVLSNMSALVDGIIHNIYDSVGVSIVTKYFNEVNQLVGREHALDSEILNAIVEALITYKDSLCEKIEELNKMHLGVHIDGE